jgi:hypothetical protein
LKKYCIGPVSYLKEDNESIIIACDIHYNPGSIKACVVLSKTKAASNQGIIEET